MVTVGCHNSVALNLVQPGSLQFPTPVLATVRVDLDSSCSLDPAFLCIEAGTGECYPHASHHSAGFQQDQLKHQPNILIQFRFLLFLFYHESAHNSRDHG